MVNENQTSFRTWQWEYLSFRLCVGLWVGIILLVLVATDASAYVCYITRFTEENFATLIAFIFIKKVLKILGKRLRLPRALNFASEPGK